MKEDTNEIERLKAEAARLAEENSAIRRLANKYLAEVASKDKQFEDYVRRMADDITSMSAEADAQIAALKAEVERLRVALQRVLSDIDFMVESDIIPDIRDDFIYTEAHAALEGKHD
jgi:uncharacterized small protein (DUF1192 family)